jgi:hypothetical protein
MAEQERTAETSGDEDREETIDDLDVPEAQQQDVAGGGWDISTNVKK